MDICPICPMGQMSKGHLSKETLVQGDFCPRMLLPVISLLKLDTIPLNQSQIAKMVIFSRKISTHSVNFRGKDYCQLNLRLVTKYHSNKHFHYPPENKFLLHFQAIMSTFVCYITDKWAILLLGTADFIGKY